MLLRLPPGTGYMDGFWAIAAAGHVAKGDWVFAAAHSEAREELGVEVDADDLVLLCATPRPRTIRSADRRTHRHALRVSAEEGCAGFARACASCSSSSGYAPVILNPW